MKYNPDDQQYEQFLVHIKIDRVEVVAKDPDRWLTELDAKLKKLTKNTR